MLMGLAFLPCSNKPPSVPLPCGTSYHNTRTSGHSWKNSQPWTLDDCAYNYPDAAGISHRKGYHIIAKANKGQLHPAKMALATVSKLELKTPRSSDLE